MHYTLIHMDETESTNLLAMEKIAAGEAAEGLVVTAGYQTKGKGTGTNRWESRPNENLLFSVILQPNFLEPARQFLLTQIVSLSVKQLLEEKIKDVPVTVKWPNDIYAGDKKIAGILIQNIIQGNHFSYAVVGIGINVNQKKFYSDAPNPVSMIQLTGKRFSTDELLHDFLSLFDNLYENHLPFQALKKNYEKALYRFKEPAQYIARGQRFTAEIVDVTDYGQLVLLRKDNGKREVFNFKEVSFMIP